VIDLPPPAQIYRVPSPPMATTAATQSNASVNAQRLSQFAASGGCYFFGAIQISPFYLGVPRYRGYRRARGRQSYRAQSR